MEQKVLWYVAGYVCCCVRDKLEKSSHPHKKDMVLFIASELSGDEWDESVGTEEWLNSVDHGGLWHVNDTIFTLFYTIEEELRKYFKQEKIKKPLD